MNKIFFTFVFLFVSKTSYAGTAVQALQSDSKTKIQIQFNCKNGTPTFVKGTFPASGDKLTATLGFIEKHKQLFLLMNPQNELKLKNSKIDKLGMTHLRLNQTYKGIPVWANQIIVHFDKNSNIYMINGRYEPTHVIDINPVISRESAIAKAKSDLKNEGTIIKKPTCELVIFTLNKNFSLSWLVNVKTYSPETIGVWKYFIDAKTGEVLLKYNNFQNDGPTTGTGMLLNGDTVNLDVYDLSGQYYLADASKPMWTSTPPDLDSIDMNLYNGTINTWDARTFTNSDSFRLICDPNGDKMFDDDTTIRAGVCASYYAESTYTYYYNTFGRNSWDDMGSSILSVVNYGQNYLNAGWTGECMVYGNGDNITFSNFSGSLDVVSHELTHAVNQATADLVYLGQHGALSEAFSDFFSCMVDREDWTIGEDIYTPGTPGDVLRDIPNPHNSYGGTRQLPVNMSEFIYWPNTYASSADNGGVHYNLTIPCHAGYVMSNLLTKEVAEQLWYRALSVYLTPLSFFLDLRYSLLQSAWDIYPSQFTTVANAIITAFDSVGIIPPDTGLYVLSYDNGIPKYNYYPGLNVTGDSIWSFSVRFCPVQPCSLKQAYLMLYKDTTGNPLTLNISVHTDRRGSPDNLIRQQQITAGQFTPVWDTVEFNPPIEIDDQFHIVVSSPNPGQRLSVAICSDSGSSTSLAYDNCIQCCKSTNTDTGWKLDWKTRKKLLGDLMINAVVSYSVWSGPGINENETFITNLLLSQNYPNPFAKTTTINYQLPAIIPMSLKIYDLTGRLVKTLVNGIQNSGTHNVNWDGSDDTGKKLSAGIYFCRIETINSKISRKITLLR